jgi:bifunctional non-homologous end joining protein LigD
VTWTEVERGVEIDDFRLDNLPARVAKLGDLWAPVVAPKDRVPLDRFVGAKARGRRS